MEDCLFCKIIKGEIPCHKIYEDENSIGILDIFPNTKGQCVIITKKHFPSDYTEMPDNEFQKFILSAKKMSEIFKDKLKVNRVAFVIEGMGVNHAHIKLYPMYGIEKKFKETVAHEKVFYERYPGFVDSRSGNRADNKDLEEIHKLLTNNN
jgi:diadenosine tetraphosphate (Ap4A) HIT family hydrolase